MLHRKILEPALEQLDGERATYFTAVADKIAEDPRIDRAPNLVYLVLKEALPYLPCYLAREEFVDCLFKFVARKSRDLNRIIYSRHFVEGSDNFRKVSNEFVGVILDATLARYDEGEIESGETKVYRFTWPYDNADFPYIDDEDD